VVPLLGPSFSSSSCFAFLLRLSISSVDVAHLRVHDAGFGGNLADPEWCVPEWVVGMVMVA